MGRDAGRVVAGGCCFCPVRSAEWKYFPAEKHDHLSRLLPYCDDARIPKPYVAMAYSKAGLSESERMNDEEQEARRILLREALVHLDRKRSKSRDQAGIYSELV